MHPQPARDLQNLLRRYGLSLVHDPQRTEALLADLCGEYQREIFVLVHAQRHGIAAELSQIAGQPAEGALRQRLARRLQERYAFSDEAAAWAVDSWAEALNIRAVPVYQSWLLVFWHALRHWAGALIHRGRGAQSRPHSPVSTNPARRLFRGIGVQWKGLSARSRLWLGLAASLAAIGWATWQFGWLESAASLAVWQATPAADEGWQPPSPAGAATALARRYTPPLEARIEADLLNVRSQPGLDAEVLGKVGPLGANVTVDGFSETGEWSHIGAPVAGWISNEFVTFAGGTAGRVRLAPGLAQVIQAGTPIRSEPRADAASVATLVAGQTLVVVAVSADGQWRQVVEPAPGWVESRFIEWMER